MNFISLEVVTNQLEPEPLELVDSDNGRNHYHSVSFHYIKFKEEIPVEELNEIIAKIVEEIEVARIYLNKGTDRHTLAFRFKFIITLGHMSASPFFGAVVCFIRFPVGSTVYALVQKGACTRNPIIPNAFNFRFATTQKFVHIFE